MFKSKKTKKGVLIIGGAIFFIWIINLVVSSVIENKIASLIANNQLDYYNLHIGKPQFKLLQQSLVIDNIELESKIKLSVKLHGFGLLKLIWNAEIDIYNLEINGLHIINSKGQEHKEEESIPFDTNAITIKNINGFEIDWVVVNDFKYQIIDVKTKETTFITEPINFKTDGFILEKYQDDLFKLLPIDNFFSISDINFKMKEAHYSFSLADFNIDFNKNIITLNQLHFKPLIPKTKLGNLYPFCDDVYNLELEELKIHNFQLNKLLRKEGVFIDSISIAGVNLELYKDKRKPFNTSNYKQLPHISLRHSKTPISISKLNVHDSNITIEERVERNDTLMSVVFADASLNVQNITSIDSLRQKPMVVDIKANLMKKAPMAVHAEFSLLNDFFSFNGELGHAKLNLFDSALFPVVGLKILQGDLKGLTFTAYADNVKSHGQMIMLYDNLEAKVFKSDSFETNKFLSWSVNTLVKQSNPTKNKPPKAAVMGHERETYKGIGNYMWKTILNGITNTISPGGKHVNSHHKSKKHSN